MHPLGNQVDKSMFYAALELADLALYRAKHLGRNQSVGLVATSPLSAEVLENPFAIQLDDLLAASHLRWMRYAA